MSEAEEAGTPVDLVALKAQLDALPIDQKTKDKILNDTQKKVGDGARLAVHDAVQKIVAHEQLKEARNSLAGLNIKIVVRYPDEEGKEVEVESAFTKAGTRSVKSATAGSTSAGKRVMVDGVVYASSAAACRSLDFEYEGRNAFQVLQGRLKKEEIHELLRGDEIPAEDDVEEVIGDDDEDDNGDD